MPPLRVSGGPAHHGVSALGIVGAGRRQLPLVQEESLKPGVMAPRESCRGCGILQGLALTAVEAQLRCSSGRWWSQSIGPGPRGPEGQFSCTSAPGSLPSSQGGAGTQKQSWLVPGHLQTSLRPPGSPGGLPAAPRGAHTTGLPQQLRSATKAPATSFRCFYTESRALLKGTPGHALEDCQLSGS